MLAEKEFYQLHQQKILELLQTSAEKGLSSREVNRRQREYGYNNLPEAAKKGMLGIFLEQFQDFMILVLIGATILSIIMGEYSDAVTIFAIIIINAIMGFVQEFRAERSLNALKMLTAPEARIIRDGKISDIRAEELVPGDILLLNTGDKIPADARILETKGLQVDESLLTGESVPVNKSEDVLYAPHLTPGSQLNMLFMGTTVTRGKCKAVITGTGLNTEMGKIADMLSDGNRSLTPLQKRLKYLGKWLVLLSILITVLIVVIGVLKGQSIYGMFLAGVSLAVAAIPEGLPAIVTLALAIGVQRMIKNNAIVRRLPAVETLGCATVICSDKTGTLTKNQMTLKKVYFNQRILNFETGINGLDKLLTIGALCNNCRLKEEEKSGPLVKVKEMFLGSKLPDLIGDPTDIALAEAVYQYNYTLSQLQSEYNVLQEEPFDSYRKRMSILVEKNQTRELWIKGAAEIIINLSSFTEVDGKLVKLTPRLKTELLEANNSMAEEALRVLAVAYRPVGGRSSNYKLKDLEDELIIVGLVGLIDPPRPEAYQAVKKCHLAGIKPVMITGDHSITARTIAEELGIIPRHGQVLEGQELKQISDKRLKNIVQHVKVFARVSPEDKLRIVRAFKENGEIVAMTGDGVNDAPAVKEADIGVAMGKKGTDVTKEVSSLILADDNFATIVAAIREGRKIYNNIRKFIRYLLSCNIGELLSVFMGIVMGLPLPLLPIQILWVNLVTDGLPALALGMDEDSDDVMVKKPRDPEESIFAHGMVSRILSQGSLIGISTMLAFLIAIYRLDLDLNTARTMAFSTLVFSQLFFVFSCRSEDHTFWNISPFGNVYLVGAVLVSTLMQLVVIYHPFFNRIFQTSVLELDQWIIVLLLSTWSTVVLEIFYSLFDRNNK